MSERKNINKIFQENFENFEMHPDEMVWENIKTKLEEKKEKRRILPIWWRLSGVAAALIIGFLVYHNESETLQNNGATIAHQEKEFPNNSIETASTNSLEEKERVANSNDEKSSINTAVSNDVTNENIHLKSTSKITKSNIKTVPEEITKTTIAASEKINSTTKTNRNSILPAGKKEVKVVAYTASKLKKSGKKTRFITPRNVIATAVNKNIKTGNSVLHSDSVNKNIVSNTISPDKDKSEKVSNIKSDLILFPKIDSVKVAVIVPNALEELLKEKDTKTIVEAKLKRWQISSNLAPVYFSSTTNGSPLDAKLESNNKVYAANNTSYGLGLNYAINKKLKVRTGVNVLNVEYTTNGIVYFQNNSASAGGKLNNLNPNVSGASIIIESLSNVTSPFNKITSKSEGNLNQKFGYIEMPLEITYKILDKKFDIDVVGGMSTLVLNRNEIYLQSQDLNLKIGEANNLNQVHFSGNLGLGIKYGLFKNLDARIEPIIKYQLKTFSNDSGNFKPYIFGVYSGILYSF